MTSQTKSWEEICNFCQESYYPGDATLAIHRYGPIFCDFLELQFQLMMSGVDMDTVRSGEILSRLEHENDIERE